MKTEKFDGKIEVSRSALDARNYLVKWTRPEYPTEALVLQGEELSRLFAERVAAGENPIKAAYALTRSRAMSKAGKAGGGLAWAGLSKDERSARARAAAAVRWQNQQARQAAE